MLSLIRYPWIAVVCAGLLSAPAFAAPKVTPLDFGLAIEQGNLMQARQWLDEGLDPNFIGDRVGTGLMIGAWEGNVPMMALFFERGARLDMTNKNGEQALQLAAFKGHMAAVQWLLEKGAPINRDGKAWSALHYAVFSGHREIAKLLMARGANVNARLPNDASALMLAAREGHDDLTADLLKAGADPTIKNDRGETALNWAMLHGHPGIAKQVSSPEAFANAVRAQAENPPPPPIKSVAAPSQIDELIRRIHYAESQNLPTTGLRKALATAIDKLRQDARQVQAERDRKDAKVVKGIVVTAKRNGSGERVEVAYGKEKTAGVSASNQSTLQPPGKDDNIANLLRQINEAKAKGQPVDALRKQLMDTIAGFRNEVTSQSVE